MPLLIGIRRLRLFLRHLARRPGARPAAGERRVSGLRAEARIVRDAAGIPHIHAAHFPDGFFAFGYAMAEDRLWQLDLWRRMATGRVAECFGSRVAGGGNVPYPLRGLDLVQIDAFARALGFDRVGTEELRLVSAEGREALEAFAGGVNCRLAEALAAGGLPIEFAVVGLLPEPWRPEDSLAIGKLIGWRLSLAFQADLAHELLASHPLLRELLPRYRPEWPSIVPTPVARGLLDLDTGSRAVGGGSGAGSNSWVVSGSRTASGKPILANDPHLPFVLPCVWYQASVQVGPRRVIGGSLPGVPVILTGHNGQVAWGVTSAMPDDGDFYVETLDPARADHVLRDGRSVPMTVREEAIRVRGEAGPRRVRLRFVNHGGVECPLVSDFTGVAGEGALSFRWVGMEPWPALDAFLALARATSGREAEAALRLFAVPAQHFIYADQEGHIGYALGGKLPRRRPPGSGAVPRPAGGDAGWDGYLPWEILPRLADPPEGLIVTANHQAAPGLVDHFWEPPYRARRIRELLEGAGRLTADRVAAMQQDVRSVQARDLVGALLGAEAPGLGAPEARQAAGALLGWDGTVGADSREAALFHTFYQDLLRRVFAGPLEERAPGLFRRYFSILHLGVGAADAILSDPASAWFPDGRGALVEASLIEAWRRVGRRGIAWGRIHRLTLPHTLGAGRGLSRVVDRILGLSRGPYPHGGDGMTVNLAAYLFTSPFTPLVGPTYRQVIDLGDLSASRWIVAGGASGDPRSPHYTDQLDRWRAGEYLPMVFRPPDAPGGTLLRLLPEGAFDGPRV